MAKAVSPLVAENKRLWAERNTLVHMLNSNSLWQIEGGDIRDMVGTWLASVDTNARGLWTRLSYNGDAFCEGLAQNLESRDDVDLVVRTWLRMLNGAEDDYYRDHVIPQTRAWAVETERTDHVQVAAAIGKELGILRQD